MSSYRCASSCLVFIASSLPLLGNDGAVSILAEARETGLALQWNWPTDLPADGPTHSVSEIQWSADMGKWTTLTDGRGPIGGGGPEQLEVDVASDLGVGFFRTRQCEQRALALDGGAEVFGLGRAFERALEAMGFPTVNEFAGARPTPTYLSTLSFDPTDEFVGDPGGTNHRSTPLNAFFPLRPACHLECSRLWLACRVHSEGLGGISQVIVNQ